MEIFTWGIVGAGWIASEFANDMKLAKSAIHKVGAVMDKTLDSAKEFAEKHEVEVFFDDINEFLKEAKVDAVYIATPHPFHYRDTITCLNHGLPVLCEKPIAINSEQLTQMADAAKKNNLFLMEGMWIRFLPSITYVLNALKNEALGKIKSVSSTLSYVEEKDAGNRFFNPELGGGSLLDLGSYSVYLAHLLLGKPQRITATAELTNEKVDKTCTFELFYNEGAKTTGYSTFMTNTPNTAEIVCELGKIVVEDAWNERASGITITYNGGRVQNHTPQWEGHGFQFEIDEVYKSISSGKKENEDLPLSLSLDMTNTLDEIRALVGVVYPYDANPEATPED